MQAAEIRARLAVPWRHGDCVDLAGVTCEGALDISGLALTGVDFSGASFPDGIDATGTQFLGVSWFSDVRIGGPARFARVLFSNDARFERALFAGIADFSGVELRGIARFDDARFAGSVSFDDAACYGNFSLQGVATLDKASFRRTEWLGGLWCESTHFAQMPDFGDSQVHGRLWLRGAVVGNVPLARDAFALRYGYSYI